MLTPYPLESLWRHPVEWYTSAISLLFAAAILCFPATFLLTPVMRTVLSIGLSGLALWRFRQGWRVVRYRRHIQRLPRYELSLRQLPVSSTYLFLGKGFRWQPLHTQRLYDCQRVPFLKPAAVLGGNPALHGVELKEQAVWMPLRERVGHMLVLGTTRVGKTRFLEVQAAQDIRRGDVVIVFDPKGDGDLLRRLYGEAKRCGRDSDMIVFHLGFPDVSARYNPIHQFARVTEVANRLANQLPSSGESAAFKEFAWRFVNIIARALVALGRRPDYQQIQRYILTIDSLLVEYCQRWLPKLDPSWEIGVKHQEETIDKRSLPVHLQDRPLSLIALVQYIQDHHYYDPIAEGLCSAFNYDKTYFDKITASLLPLLEKLTTGKVAELISPNYFDLNDKRPIFDWLQVIRGRKIVYVGLDALSDKTIATAVGSSMFSDLCSVAGQLYKFGVEHQNDPYSPKIPHAISVHGDEFNELANEDVVTLLNKGGGAGFQMTLYTQTWSDVETRLGSAAKTGQVAGNLNTIVCLRVQEERTALLLTSKLPQRVPIYSLQPFSSVSDAAQLGAGSDFSSSNDDRIAITEVPLLTPADLMQLPKGHAFCLMEGSQLWKIRLPLPQEERQASPQTVEQIIAALYASLA